MREVFAIGLKAVAGGTLVAAFALLSDRLKPKTLAGVFSGATSVALASLGVTAAAMGSGKAAEAATSMFAGAVGMVVFCGLAVMIEQRIGSIASSALAWLAWAVTAGGVYWVMAR